MKIAPFHRRFITAVASLKIHHGFRYTKEAATFLDMEYQRLQRIMIRKDYVPTVEEIQNICEKEGISANWILLNKGSLYMSSSVSANGEESIASLD